MAKMYPQLGRRSRFVRERPSEAIRYMRIQKSRGVDIRVWHETVMRDRPLILIVDDDREIRSLLAEQLQDSGFDARQAEDGRAMRRALEREAVDLVVLDLNLPREDGLTLCRDLRARSALPVIMLTARADPIDRVLGLEMGADDYVPKPFEPRELVARIRNVLRRHTGLGPLSEDTPTARRLLFDGWALDIPRRCLEAPDGRTVMLSGAEFRVLKAMAEQAGRVFTREQLARIGAGRNLEPTDRGVDLQVSRLRAKLGEDARSPVLIKTVRNEGYVLASPVERQA